MTNASATRLNLDDLLKDRVERLASARSRTADWVMKEAIEQYVEREEKREQFLRDGLSAWEHFQTTGLHLTAEEADEWLAKLERGEDAPAPECHV